MANTFSVTKTERGTHQFQGAFKEMFLVTGSCTDSDAIADDVSVAVSLTVPGVELGDMFLGCTFNVSQADANASVTTSAFVSAANTVELKITNIDATADALDADELIGTFKLIFGRPAW